MLRYSPQRKKNSFGQLGHWQFILQQACKMPCFFYNGKNFALRGIGEQYRLKVSQLVRKYNPDRYVYTENGSENRSGGIGDFNVPNKVVPVYSNPAAGVRCQVFLLDMYIRKLPVEAKRDLDIFYMRPLSLCHVMIFHHGITASYVLVATRLQRW